MATDQVTPNIFNTLADVPFVIVNERSGEAITIVPSVEAVASSRSAEYLYNLQKTTNIYYSRYLKEKYGETSISKLKAFKDLHVWAGGKDYETFLEELSREGHNPGSSSSAVIREFAQKNYEEIIKPLADYGMEYDLWDYKASDLFEIDQQIKAIGKVELSKKDLLAGKATEEIEKKKAQIEELKAKRSQIEKKIRNR